MFTITLFAAMMISSASTHKIDFGLKTGGLDWEIVNDDVMGGRSSSSADLENDRLVFQGNLSLENNGGFASIRGPVDPVDLSKYEKVRLRFRGSSDEFALRLSNSTRWYLPVYKHYFRPEGSPEEWREVEFSLMDFREYAVGRPTGKGVTKDILSQVIRIGIMLSDKQEGAFHLEVDYIEFL
jgi:hypothetical protein